ncbi:TetR/AcrR family transcriptional regulator [Antrihabitans cavernicola]|uniref:TetR/AcrR family transcriptional regulator n=1 Tax=Antrihabitans cavernicola TaxID=2495913 RepID=A0A5A7SAJ3_9NOCA|nr:TetR/AcrR family transcriptional regulator [Spelaeibacter cavernicola]
MAERGRHGAGIQAVAARSGVAKSTIYRRWSSRDELIVDALAELFAVGETTLPDDPRAQLRVALRQLHEQWSDDRFRRIMRRVAADGSEAPGEYRRFRDQLVSRRRTLLLEILGRCVAAGLIRAETDLGWAADLLVAPVIVAAMTHRNDVTDEQLDFSLETVLSGLAPPRL